jgi:hypothetical protein
VGVELEANPVFLARRNALTIFLDPRHGYAALAGMQPVSPVDAVAAPARDNNSGLLSTPPKVGKELGKRVGPLGLFRGFKQPLAEVAGISHAQPTSPGGGFKC